MFELKDIFVKYSYKSVLNGISIKFEQGKIYSLLGENGAGKSTLAHVICGDINQTSGKIILNDKEVYRDLLSGKTAAAETVEINSWDFRWLFIDYDAEKTKKPSASKKKSSGKKEKME